MLGALSRSALLLSLASICDGVRISEGEDWGWGSSSEEPAEETTGWSHAASFDNFINRAAQARSMVQSASDTHQRWVAVRELVGETSEAAGEGQVAMNELGDTFQHINQEIADNELEPLLDTEMTISDLRALTNGNALIRIAGEFVDTSEHLVTISNLLEVIVDTLVAVLDLTESVPALSGAWGGFDTQHARQLTGRVSAVSARFSEEAQNLHTVNEQLAPLEGWDEMGRWGRARVVATNFNSIRTGMRGLRDSKHSLEEFYNGEAMSTMTDVVSTVQTMNSVASRFSAR